MKERSDGSVGTLYALGAFGIWGFMPLYFKAVKEVSPFELLAHRIVWSVVLVSIFLLLRSRVDEIRSALKNRQLVAMLALSATLVATNWLVYIWSVVSGQVLQSSLGYYINPLVNVLLGRLFLSERLRKTQWLAVGIATAGVLALVIRVGELPWISLTVATTFGFYGLVRKQTPVKPVVGMHLESLLLAPVSLGYLLYLSSTGHLEFGASPSLSLLLVASGLITAVPLIFFSEAARRLTLTSVGFFQYIAPSIQFLLAVALFGETFTTSHAIAFGCIWFALALYSVDSIAAARSYRVAPRSA
ncbi:MAG: EamA family transporter RarD [Myxococcota bacterium]